MLAVYSVANRELLKLNNHHKTISAFGYMINVSIYFVKHATAYQTMPIQCGISIETSVNLFLSLSHRHVYFISVWIFTIGRKQMWMRSPKHRAFDSIRIWCCKTLFDICWCCFTFTASILYSLSIPLPFSSLFDCWSIFFFDRRRRYKQIFAELYAQDIIGYHRIIEV